MKTINLIALALAIFALAGPQKSNADEIQETYVNLKDSSELSCNVTKVKNHFDFNDETKFNYYWDAQIWVKSEELDKLLTLPRTVAQTKFTFDHDEALAFCASHKALIDRLENGKSVPIHAMITTVEGQRSVCGRHCVIRHCSKFTKEELKVTLPNGADLVSERTKWTRLYDGACL